MLYLYAIIEPPAAPFALPRGLEGARPDVLALDGFSLVTGPLRAAPPREDAAIGAHMAVLGALMRRCTPLPARFGTVSPSYDELARSMSDMRDVLIADLRRLRGTVELGLCATAPELPPAAPMPDDVCALSPGLRYIAAKRAEHAQRLRGMQAGEALAAKIGAPFAALASAQAWRALPTAVGCGISAAFLLPRDRLDAFHLALAELRRAEPNLDILLTGPWPPFTFVGDGARTFAERAVHGTTARHLAS